LQVENLAPIYESRNESVNSEWLVEIGIRGVYPAAVGEFG